MKTLTSLYKQIQDSFAEQVVIYLQTAWRRHNARKVTRRAITQVVQLATTRTTTPGTDNNVMVSAPIMTDE